MKIQKSLALLEAFSWILFVISPIFVMTMAFANKANGE